MSLRRSGLSLLAVFLAGCTTAGVDYAPPKTAPVTGYASQPSGVTGAEAEARWWRVFADPALDQLISQALSANLDAKLALARLEETRALARGTRTQRLPNGGLDSSYQRRRFADVERPDGAPRNGDVFKVGGRANWEIDLFGRVRRSVEAAEADVGGAAALLRGARAAVAADVAARYFELRGAEAALRVAQLSITNQERSLDVTRKLAAAGAGTRLDTVRADGQLRAVEAKVPPIEQQIAKSRHALAILLGQSPQNFAVPVGPSRALPQVASIAIGSPDAMLRRRPDIQAAERVLAAASARAGAARAELFPSVRLTGALSLLAGGLGNLVSGGALSLAAGPTLQWSVFDLPRLRAQVAVSDARTDAALINYHRTVLGALREVEDSLVTYGAIRSRLGQLSEQTAANREAARMVLIRFRAGEGQYLDVLDAQRTLVEAEAALVEEQAQHLISIVELYRALGSGGEVCSLPGGHDCPTSAALAFDHTTP